MFGQLGKHPPQYILFEQKFTSSSLVYSVLTELPAVFLLYDSSFWSGAFLIFIFSVSVWNGGGFYIEVFGRKYVLLSIRGSCKILIGSFDRFERELEALRKELAEATSRSERSSPTLGPQSDDDLSTVAGSPDLGDKALPSVPSVTSLVSTPDSITPPELKKDQ